MSWVGTLGSRPAWRALRTRLWPTQTFEEQVALVTGLRVGKRHTLHHLPLAHMPRHDWPVDLLLGYRLQDGYQVKPGHLAQRLTSRFEWAAAQRGARYHFMCIAPRGSPATRLVFSREDGGFSTSTDLARHLGWVAKDLLGHNFADVVQELEAIVRDGRPDPLRSPGSDSYDAQT